MNKWDQRFYSLAKEAETWSKDPKCKVGAALVSPDRREFAFGYNGLPAGLKDSEVRLGTSSLKLKLTVHAEVNAILNARRDLTGWVMYCTKAPCIDCALAIIQAGVAELHCPIVKNGSSWYDENYEALSLLAEAGILINILTELT